MENDFLNLSISTESLYENAPCGYLSFTPDGKVVKINKTLLSWLGLSNAQANNLKFTDLLSRGGTIYYEMFYFPLLRLQDVVEEINFDLLRADGSYMPALVNSNVIRSADTVLRVINATVYNITDRRRYEEELLAAKKIAEQQRNELEFLSDFVPVMIWTANRRGIVNFVNQRFTDFFGIGADSPSLFSRIHPDEQIGFLRQWLLSLNSIKGFTREVRLQDRENKHRWFIVHAEPLKGEDGNVDKWVGTCSDIDNQKSQLQQRDEFISIASHELKTPVTSLKGTLQLMSRIIAREKGLERIHSLLEMADRSMGKITMLIDDLLNTQRIQQGHIQLNLEQIEVIALLKASAIEHNSSSGPQVIVLSDSEINVMADSVRIEQVLSNLITNAKKYAPDSSAIEITAKVLESNKIRIAVKDQGPGIAEDKLPHLFERYYRADKEGRQYSGLGLGLYISAEIIQRHGGEIGVESLIGKGSTFWFTLPADSV